MRSVLCPVLVGRERECEELRGAIEQLAGGRGAAVVVAGEAGAGKSRLLRDAVAEARRGGMPVLAGRAVDGASPPPFRPLSEALCSHFRRAGPPEVPGLEPFRPVLGKIVPDWRRPGVAVSEETLVVLGEAVLRLLRAVAGRSGCVLVLEDLHWADRETIEIFEYLADNVAAEPVLCLASLRDEEATAARGSIRTLASRRAVTVVELPRLGEEEVAAMAAACLGADAVPASLRGLLTRTADGLPFLVEEVLASAVSSGALRREGGAWVLGRGVAPAVPAGFADLVRRRLRAVPGVASVLAPAALLGDSFDWSLLAAITGRTGDSVAGLLRRAVGAQLLSVEVTETRSGFRFRHALTRQAVLDELLPPERAALARRTFEAVESAHPGLPGGWCELAAALAEQAGSTGRAVELLREAAQRSLTQAALATAEAILERARRLAGSDPVVAVDVDDTLSEVLALAGKREALGVVSDRLLRGLSATAAWPGRRARVHIRLARAAVVASDWVTATHHLGLARSAGCDAAAAAEADVLGAQVALGEGRLDDAAGLGRAALAAAGRAGRHELACEALEIIGRRERQRDLAEAERAFTAARSLAEARGLALWRIRALHELATIDLLAGGPVDRLVQARQAALDAGALATAATAALQMGAWFLNHVELDAAIEAARSCAAEAARLRLPVLHGFGLLFEAGAYALRGQRAEMEACSGQALAVAGDNPEVRGAAALQMRSAFFLVREDRPAALRELDAGMELLRATPVTAPFRGLWALLRTIEDRDGEAAAAEVEASGLTVYWMIRGWIGHARAVSAGRQGRPRQAEAAFAAADAEFARCAWHRHHTRRLVAEAALTDGWGDPQAWLVEALGYFDAAGYDHIASACRSLLRRAGARVPRRRRQAPGVPQTLAALGITAREAEVLELLAGARPTREIATRLYLSPKTVERHIANLAGKVGVEGRAELIAFAASHLAEAG